MTVNYPPRLSLIHGPTPLMPLRRLSAQLNGPTIWVKRDDLTGCAVSGNKIRKLEFTLAAALEQGCDTIITCGGVQSNHCRTTALLCAQLGLKCHLLLRGAEQPADGNLLLDKLAGAEITFYPESEYRARAGHIFDEWMDHYRALGATPFSVPVGASDGIGAWGYIAACEELAVDFARHQIKPRYIVTATGSGGTQAGLTIGSHLHQLGTEVHAINVCDDEQYFIDKVSDDIEQWRQWYQQPLSASDLSIHVIDGYVGPGYAKATQAVFGTIQRLARTEGLILDPVYTGKAFHGLIDQIEKGRFADSDDIVFIHTGGIFGLFPQRDQLCWE